MLDLVSVFFRAIKGILIILFHEQDFFFSILSYFVSFR